MSVPLTLLQRFKKGYSRFACERELETEHNCNILTPTLMAISVVSFLFFWCSTGGPVAQLSAGWWLSLLHLISIFSGPQLIRAPSPFGLVWLSLPHLVYLRPISNWNSNCLTSVLTELYNSSTPTRFLKSHVWSSSSGNNCHAVHRSSLFWCISLWVYHGNFFSLSHFISQFPPTRFPLITAIRMCHFLPVHHLEWHFWPGRRSKCHTTNHLGPEGT